MEASAFDLLVVGGGVYGLCVACKAAEAGLSVYLCEQGIAAGSGGSSHGGARLFRYTTVEDVRYHALAERSAELWDALNVRAGGGLISRTGFVLASDKGTDQQLHHGVENVVATARAVARQCGVDHQVVQGADVAREFPWLAVGEADTCVAFVEPGAFTLDSDRVLEELVIEARTLGVQLAFETRIGRVDSGPDKVALATSRGPVSGRSCVVAAGPWAGGLLGSQVISSRIYPQIIYWTADRPENAPPMPFVATRPMLPLVYGFPARHSDGAIKLGVENTTFAVDSADRLDTTMELQRRFPADTATSVLRSRPASVLAAERCYYTVEVGSRMRAFWVGAEPVICVSSCSGHGFKFAPAIAEAVVGAIQSRLASGSAIRNGRANAACSTHDLALVRGDPAG